MMIKTKLIITAAIFYLVGCTNMDVPAYKAIGNMSNCEKEELIQQVKISDMIFIGNIVSIDTGWAAPAGVTVSTRNIEYQIKSIIRGNSQNKRILVSYAFVTPREGLLQDESNGFFRLDSRYYRPNRDYFVGCSYKLAASWKMNPSYPINIFTIDHKANVDTFPSLELMAR